MRKNYYQPFTIRNGSITLPMVFFFASELPSENKEVFAKIRKFLENFSLLFFLKQNPAEGGRRKFKEI